MGRFWTQGSTSLFAVVTLFRNTFNMDLSKPWTSDPLALYADQTTSNQHSYPATISYLQQQPPSLILVNEWGSKNTIAVLGQWMVSILFLRQTAASNLLVCWPLCCLVGLQIMKRKHSSSVDVDPIKMLCKRMCWPSVRAFCWELFQQKLVI